MILVVITVFIQLIDSRVQALVALLIGAVSYLLNIWFQPYENEDCNVIEKRAMYAVLWTVFLGNFLAFGKYIDLDHTPYHVYIIVRNRFKWGVEFALGSDSACECLFSHHVALLLGERRAYSRILKEMS